MKKILAIAAIAVIQLTGCDTITAVQNQSPPAKQPSDVQVSSAIGPNPGWIAIAPDTAGKFPVLPLSDTNRSIKVVFFAPYPSSVEVAVDGAALKKKEDLPNDLNIQLDSGFFEQVDIKQVPSNPNELQWTLTIVPPRAKWNSGSLDISLTDVSINPNHTGTPQGRSQPALIPLTRLMRNIVTVTRAGPGSGRVFDSIGVIDCGATCGHDYGQSRNVLLNAEGFGMSVVTGWSGAPCISGSTNSCTIALDGTPKNITVKFGPEPDFAQGNFVPVSPRSPCGYTASLNGNAIEIKKSGTLVASHIRQGQGTWNVFFNQNGNIDVCGSALVVERGVPLAGPHSREQLTQYTLGLRSNVQVNSITADAFGKIFQSPDGRVFAISREATINPTAWFVDYLKVQGVMPGKLMGTEDMNTCDVTMQSNIFPKMQASNNAAVQCYGDPSRSWKVTALH